MAWDSVVLDKVRVEFSLTAVACNLRRAINLIGIQGLIRGRAGPNLTPKGPPCRHQRPMAPYRWRCTANNPQPTSWPSSSALQSRPSAYGEFPHNLDGILESKISPSA